VEVAAGSPVAGQTVGEIEAGGAGFVIVAVKRPDGSLARATDSTLKINVGDAIVLLGHNEVTPQLIRRARASLGQVYRGVRV
jgi:Trk K+ transport system NAD-binding subunit